MESFVANCKFPIGAGGGFTLLVVRYHCNNTDNVLLLTVLYDYTRVQMRITTVQHSNNTRDIFNNQVDTNDHRIFSTRMKCYLMLQGEVPVCTRQRQTPACVGSQDKKQS